MIEIQNEKFSWTQTSWFFDLNFFLKKGVLCVHACMGGIYVHICSCVYPYIQMHGDSNINVVYFPQSLFTLIFSGRTIQKLKLELTWHTNERILSEINLGGLPHPLLVVQFWAEILDHQDDAEDKYPSLSASLCEQFPQSSCHHSLPPPPSWTVSGSLSPNIFFLASWITSGRMFSYFNRKITKSLGILGFYFFHYFPSSASN